MEIVPGDSRYVPLTQQPYCCVPTCLQMVMMRHGLPLVPAELLGWHTGLVVPSDAAQFFYNPRVSDIRPASGYGTQLHQPGFEPNAVFAALGIKLHMELELIDTFTAFDSFQARLRALAAADRDVLLCFQVAALTGEKDQPNGHVCVLDRLEGDDLRMIDPARAAKWRVFSQRAMYDAMRVHGAGNAGGLWLVSPA